MTVRFDPSRLHAGRVTLSVYPGRGILADNAPSAGDSGPALGYRAEWFGKEVRCEIAVQPTNGTLELFEDTSFIYTGDGQADTAEVQIFLDGVAEPTTEPLQFNPATVAQNYSTTAAGNTLSNGFAVASAVNAQHYSTTAQGNNLSGGQAVTSSVNTPTNVQNYGTTATGNTVTAGVAVTSAINVAPLIQHYSTTAQGNSITGGQAITSSVNMASLVQHFSSTASGNVICRGVAITSFYDDGYVPPFSKKGLSATVRRPVYSANLIQ
jgi:hypothetical protein